MYDQSINLYRQERKKTEKLLTDLLPKQVIRQMKKVIADDLPGYQPLYFNSNFPGDNYERCY